MIRVCLEVCLKSYKVSNIEYICCDIWIVKKKRNHNITFLLFNYLLMLSLLLFCVYCIAWLTFSITDHNHPFVEEYADSALAIPVFRHEKFFVVPCRTTYPNQHVTLETVSTVISVTRFRFFYIFTGNAWSCVVENNVLHTFCASKDLLIWQTEDMFSMIGKWEIPWAMGVSEFLTPIKGLRMWI